MVTMIMMMMTVPVGERVGLNEMVGTGVGAIGDFVGVGAIGDFVGGDDGAFVGDDGAVVG